MSDKDRAEWLDFVERSAGSWQGEPLKRSPQGDYEKRKWPEKEHEVTVLRDQQIENLKNMRDEDIDFSDAPEATSEQLKNVKPFVLKGFIRPTNKS